MIIATVFLVSALADKPAIPWRNDEPQALADAEAQGKVVLIQFRTACGRVSTPNEADEIGRSVHMSEKPDCDLMVEDVWSHPDVMVAAQRFVPILTGDMGQAKLNTRYGVSRPTTVFADPWGNEIVKLVGYIPRDRMLRVMLAMPRDFGPLRNAALALRQDRTHFAALVAAASFYETGGLREFADRYYQAAQASPDTRADSATRRGAAIARGMNLMQMGKHGEAADLFADTLKQAPDGPMAEALLLGQVMAEVQRGRKKDAQRALEELKRRFPDSPYTAKAREQLGAH